MQIFNNLWIYFFGGKKMGADDFEGIRKFIECRDAEILKILMGVNGYGLLYEAEVPFRLELNGDRLQLFSLYGVTVNGSLIVQHDRYSKPLFLDLPKSSDKRCQDIFIKTERVEKPMNHLINGKQHRIPVYRLELGQESKELNFFNQLKIGELLYENGEYKLKNYIPPCRHLGAHPILWKAYLEFKKYWRELDQNTPNILAYSLESAEYSEKSDLYRLASAVDKYLLSNSPVYLGLNELSHPNTFLDLIRGLAQTFSRQLEVSRLSQRRTHLLSIFKEVTNSSTAYLFEQQGFLDSISMFAKPEFSYYHQYNHNCIEASLKTIKIFLTHVSEIWKRLKEPAPNLQFDDISSLD